jgi:dihydropteroate synthase
VVQRFGTGLILMHSRGTRESLHQQARMEDPLAEVIEGLSSSIRVAFDAGIPREAIVVDPGIGFGKDVNENLRILKNLQQFSTLRHPLLVGTSRKSVIRSIVRDQFESRTWGTAAAVTFAIAGGAHIVRVHDIRQGRVLADVADGILSA